MSTAIISDIHANIEALEAVLEDIDKRGIEEIVCCGDIIGYGPDPNKCLRIVRRRGIKSVMGNHDFAVTSLKNFEKESEKVHVGVKTMFSWTYNNRLSEDEKEYLRKLPYLLEFDNFLVSHGSAADDEIKLFRYIEESSILGEDSIDMPVAEKNLEKLKREDKQVLFYGHRHKPRIFTDVHELPTHKLKHDEKGQTVEIEFPLSQDVYYLINVGSVGQPRDKDPRACYAIYNEDSVAVVRVEYDFTKTQEKIRAIPELSKSLKEYLANRLAQGK